MKYTDKEVVLVISTVNRDTGVREVIKQEHMQNVTNLCFDEYMDCERDPVRDHHEPYARHISLTLTLAK